jgi:hypothetical protein
MFFCISKSITNIFVLTIISALFGMNAFGESSYGKQTIPYAIPPIFENATYFSEGLAAVKINHKWGFIDKTGKIVIEPQFNFWQAQFNSAFSDGLVAVNFNNGKDESFKQDGNNVSNVKWGFADKKGRLVIPPKFEGDYFQPPRFTEGLAPVIFSSMFPGSQSFVGIGAKFGYIDKTGEYVIKPIYDKAINFQEGLAAVTVDGKEGFINTKGEVVIPLIYKLALSFENGYAIVVMNDKYSFIDKSGNNPFNKQFDSLSEFSDGLARFEEGGKYGFIDINGNVVIKPFITPGSVIDWIGGNEFSEGLCAVKFGYDPNKKDEFDNGKYGYINKTGKVVINPIFNSANGFKNGRAVVAIDGKSFLIDKSGNRISQYFNDLTFEADGMIKVNAGDMFNTKYGYIKN